jgi:hypothetical protein
MGERYQQSGDWDPADPELRFGFGREELDTYAQADESLVGR